MASKHSGTLRHIDKYFGPVCDDNHCLNSLSEARNCLSHNLGVVNSERAPDGELVVLWMAIQAQLLQGERVIILDESTLPLGPVADDPPARIQVCFVMRKKAFTVGSLIAFSPDELLELCLFYQSVIDRLCMSVQERVRETGVFDTN